MRVNGHWSVCKDDRFWIFFLEGGGGFVFPLLFISAVGKGGVSFGLFYSFLFGGGGLVMYINQNSTSSSILSIIAIMSCCYITIGYVQVAICYIWMSP